MISELTTCIPFKIMNYSNAISAINRLIEDRIFFMGKFSLIKIKKTSLKTKTF